MTVMGEGPDPPGSGSLDGLCVVVTRPAHQAESLACMIEAEGGRVIRFPVLEIAPIEDPEPALALADQLDDFELAIFISANAVEHGVALVRSRREWPAALNVAAVGPATARALEAQGLQTSVQPPQTANSEGLLAAPALAAKTVSGRKIVIFRGRGGREHLRDVLTCRGAEVHYAEVYRRVRAQADPARLLRDSTDAVVVTSGDSLHNLFTIVGEAGYAWLRARKFVVVSARVAELARARGVETALAAGAGDAALLDALRILRNSKTSRRE